MIKLEITEIEREWISRALEFKLVDLANKLSKARQKDSFEAENYAALVDFIMQLSIKVDKATENDKINKNA